MATIEQDVLPTLGEALRLARIAAGFAKQLDAAGATGYREKDFSRWETGAAVPGGKVLVRLSRLYSPHLDLSKVRDMGRYLWPSLEPAA